MVVSLDYRLAPEHRLPAAYDDGFAALQWLTGENTDPWLVKYADLSSVFVMGDSSGANLVHHLIVRAARRAGIVISGSILIQPSFGSTKRKPSEMDKSYPSNKVLPSVVLLDRLWELALPPEASRDHPSCNVPLAANDLADLPMPPSLVVVGGLDVLRDHGMDYVNSLRDAGKDVELLEFCDCDHAFYFDLGAKSTAKLIDSVTLFVRKAMLIWD